MQMPHHGDEHQHQTECGEHEEQQDGPADIDRELPKSSEQHAWPRDFIRAMKEFITQRGTAERIADGSSSGMGKIRPTGL